jgi:hypothetical protein
MVTEEGADLCRARRLQASLEGEPGKTRRTDFRGAMETLSFEARSAPSSYPTSKYRWRRAGPGGERPDANKRAAFIVPVTKGRR